MEAGTLFRHYPIFFSLLLDDLDVRNTGRTFLPGAPALSVVLQNIKKFTAVQSNKLLSRSGKFWAEESFDTIIRNEKHFYNTIYYIINNPVKAGLVNNWWEWKWTYLCEELASENRLEKRTLNNK